MRTPPNAPKTLRHDAASFGCQRAADTVFLVVGQAQVVTHLVRDGRGHSNGVRVVVLWAR